MVRLVHQKTIQGESQHSLRLRFRPPYNWEGMLRFLAPRATPGVEQVEGGRYRRAISLDGIHGCFEVALDRENHELAVQVQFGNPQRLAFIIERIRAMFDLDADWVAIVRCLKTDAALAQRIKVAPGLRVPRSWSGFELAVRAILGQQVTVKGATVLAGRLAATFGQRCALAPGLTCIFPTPEVLADGKVASIGLPKARAETIRALARAVCEGTLRFEGATGSDEFLERLCEIPGIGTWTAQYIAMRALGEPDAFPSSDLGLLRALDLQSPRELERRAEAWRPWRAYAAMYLWNVPGDVETKRAEPSNHKSRKIAPEAGRGRPAWST